MCVCEGFSHFCSSCVLLVKEHHFMSHYLLLLLLHGGCSVCMCVYVPGGFHCFYTAQSCPASQKKQVRYKVRVVGRWTEKKGQRVSEWVSERFSAREACVWLNRGKYHGLHWTEACPGLIPESTPAFPYTLGQNRQLEAVKNTRNLRERCQVVERRSVVLINTCSKECNFSIFCGACCYG